MERRERIHGLAVPFIAVLALAAACAGPPAGAEEPARERSKAAPAAGPRAEATFAGGCFWCMEPPFDALDGVISTTSGYIGGEEADPGYKSVSSGATGHAEAVKIVFDPTRVTYERLLEVYWVNTDPTTADRQFCDVGRQYRPAIFVHDESQRALAEQSKARIEQSGALKAPVATEIVDAGPFWPAEEYHQDYATKNPIRYRFYRQGCGRDKRLKQLWGDAADDH